ADPGGSLGAGDRYYIVTANVGGHETSGSSEASTTVGANGKVQLSWTAVTGASSYNVYFGTTSGGESAYLNAPGASFAADGTRSPTSAPPPAADTGEHQAPAPTT